MWPSKNLLLYLCNCCWSLFSCEYGFIVLLSNIVDYIYLSHTHTCHTYIFHCTESHLILYMVWEQLGSLIWAQTMYVVTALMFKKNQSITTIATLHSSYHREEEEDLEEETHLNHSFTMNTQMGNSLPIEKLDRSKFASWEYKMHP